MYKNTEGYSDPTAGRAYSSIRREERRREAARLEMVHRVVQVLKQTAGLAGFEIVGRITLRYKGTGREYK